MVDFDKINIKEIIKKIIVMATPEAKDLTDEQLFDGNRMTLLGYSLYYKANCGFARVSRENLNNEIVIAYGHIKDCCTEVFSPYNNYYSDIGVAKFDFGVFKQFDLYYANGQYNRVTIIDKNLHNLLTMFEHKYDFVEKVLLKK